MRIKHLHITKKHHKKKIIKIWGRNETAFGNHAAGGGVPLQPTTREGLNIITYNIKKSAKC
jgi:hypothetical protein